MALRTLFEEMQLRHRRLPHLYAAGQPLFVTFRLQGSLPYGRLFPPESITSGEAFLCVDRLLDSARSGPTYLATPSIAQIVVEALQYCSGTDYRLHAWVIMPNHVHMLATALTDVSRFMRRLKGYTARRSNVLLHRTGQAFWQEESYDHLIRTPEEFRNIEAYILNNPVKAGLARFVEEYRWSSAYAK